MFRYTLFHRLRHSSINISPTINPKLQTSNFKLQTPNMGEHKVRPYNFFRPKRKIPIRQGMKALIFRFCLITAWLAFAALSDLSIAAQSLVDAARKEAERREGLEQLGIEETVIEGNGESYSEEGNVSVLGPSGKTSPKKSAAPSSAKNQSSLSRYRKTIQKLDQNILKEEERIKRLQDRLDDLRREGYRTGDLAKRRRNEESQNRTREQIEELEVNLKLMREERSDEYNSGKKAGFLPGELDGKGIVP
jgi:hypothetical protein